MGHFSNQLESMDSTMVGLNWIKLWMDSIGFNYGWIQWFGSMSAETYTSKIFVEQLDITVYNLQS